MSRHVFIRRLVIAIWLCSAGIWALPHSAKEPGSQPVHSSDPHLYEKVWKIARKERRKKAAPRFHDCFEKEMVKRLGPEWEKSPGSLENGLIWNAVVDFCGGLQSMKVVVPATTVEEALPQQDPQRAPLLKPHTDRPALNPSSQVDDDNNNSNNTPHQFRRVTGLLNSASRFAKHNHHFLPAWPAAAKSFSPQRLEGSMMRLLRTEAL
ncbi:MAG: hypothetical protein M1826_005936 [Phylliscum demangeonii]|nr:MAG: hypothetical protein M1826_005936 [Phylliscum demangeonii]